MKVESTLVRKLTITEVASLDPVTVILENFKVGQGKIIIECYGQSWSTYWGSMGDTIEDFVCRVSSAYIINKVSNLHSTKNCDDESKVEVFVKKKIIQLRREKELTDEYARSCFDDASAIACHLMHGHGYGGALAAKMCVEIFGDDYWHSMPQVPNEDYLYLERIVDAVKAALIQMKADSLDPFPQKSAT